MKVLYQYCEQGDGEYNEDAILATSRFACVVDGATDVYLEDHPQLRGIVHKYVCELVNCLNTIDKTEKTIKEVVKKALEDVYCVFEKQYSFSSYMEYELPTFSIACVKENNDEYEYLVLGDCFLLFSENKSVKLIEDTRIRFFSEYNRDELKRLKLDPRHDKKSVDIYKNTRKKANSPFGYPIGSVRGTGIDKALCGKISKDEVNGIMIFSDGFIDFFNRVDIEYEKLFNEEYLKYTIAQADRFYHDNELYMEQLRPKQCDDRSIIMTRKDEV